MATSTLPNKSSSLMAHPIFRWLFSSIGKKTVVALTGIALVLFVIGHLLGNLTFFVGPDAINAYAEKLHSLGPVLWVVRFGLLAVVGLHIYFTMLLWIENRHARPSKYEFKNRVQSTVFSRTMRLSGLVVIAFVVFHIAHFTARVIDPAYNEMRLPNGNLDVFQMMVAGFSNVWFSIFYIFALALLAFHLSHGIGSLFQTLGITNRKVRPLFDTGGKILAWALFVGFSSIPLSVILGYGKDALK